jgi:hypothetical protein
MILFAEFRHVHLVGNTTRFHSFEKSFDSHPLCVDSPRRELMNAKIQKRYANPGQICTALCIAVLIMLVSVGCAPASTQPTEQPLPAVTEQQATPTTPISTPTSEAMTPVGWGMYTSQRCEYAISYPEEMQVTNNGTYSRTVDFELANPDEGARNFIYVSVIDADTQSMSEEGIYNYDPAATEILLNMQVGESASPHEVADLAQWFTYQRLEDTLISGYPAQTYENVQPWEFPAGTKEIRYYVSLNGCTYLIGGYMDTTGSNQPGAINEELFNQIVASIQLSP